jgi:hypothetical protein
MRGVASAFHQKGTKMILDLAFASAITFCSYHLFVAIGDLYETI